MNNYTFFAAGRGGGKTTQMMRWVDEALCQGETVAVVAHIRSAQDVIARTFLDSEFECNTISERSSLDSRGVLVDRPYADVYIERTFHLARGMRYDHVYVDNAELFEDDPVELCQQFFPGVPATFTYTPYPFD